MQHPPEIAVIGGGFSGAAFTLHLLRDHPDLAAKVTIVEPRAALGAGLAYSAEAPEHRVNVAASRMSLFPEQPGHFDQWLRNRGEPERDPICEVADVGLFPARAVYGHYVGETLRQTIVRHAGTRVCHIQTRATAISPKTAPAEGYDITLEDGRTLAADIVVLAVTHTMPDLPRSLAGARPILHNPWSVPDLRAIPSDAKILIVGTGLTACDVASSLHANSHRGPITALSRHGLLPRPRTHLPVAAEGDFTTNPEHTAANLLHRARAAIAIAESQGRPWENVIDALRQQAATAWGTLDWTQRKTLLRHLRTWWDVHRFQVAPQIDAAIKTMRETGQLTILAATILHAHDNDITIRHRNTQTEETLHPDLIINCTGPGHRSVTEQHPVLQSLASAGTIQPDPARLGILVTQSSAAIAQNGAPVESLYVAGPLARGTHGELMGLPQVNTQPRAVAGTVAARIKE